MIINFKNDGYYKYYDILELIKKDDISLLGSSLDGNMITLNFATKKECKQCIDNGYIPLNYKVRNDDLVDTIEL